MTFIELKRVLTEGAVIFLVVAVLFMGILTTRYDVYLVPALEIFLLLYASFTGWSLFERERSEGAMEYVLAQPISRSRLFLVKFIPRLLMVLLLYTVFWSMYHLFTPYTIISPLDFLVIYITFFLVSLSFSICLKSFISAFFLTCILSVGAVFGLHLWDPSRVLSSLILQGNLSLLVLPVIFFILFLRFDLKPLFPFNLKFSLASVLGLLLLVGITFLFPGNKWCMHYLTSKGDVYRISCDESQLITPGQIFRLPGCHFPLMEHGSFLFTLTKKTDQETPQAINRLNLDTGKEEMLYQLPEGWFPTEGNCGYFGVVRENSYYILIKNGDLKQYCLLEFSGDKVREIYIKGDFGKDNVGYLTYVTLQPLQFFVRVKDDLFRIDEEGQIHPVCSGRAFSFWGNRFMAFDDTGFTVYNISREIVPVLQETGDFRKFLRKFGPYDLRKSIIWDREHSRHFIFNLDDLTVENIEPLPLKPYFYLEKGERFLVVGAAEDMMTTYEIRNGKIEQKAQEMIPFKGFYLLRVYPSGVIAFNSDGYWKFLFD